MAERPRRPLSKKDGGRGRSFGGCSTCRGRHVKCDEAQPTCLICSTAGLVCGGYERSIFFDFEDDTTSAAGRFRRPLFSQEERKLMSDSLIASVSPRSTLRILQEIDEICEEAIDAVEIDVSRGPFNAFGYSSSSFQQALPAHLRNGLREDRSEDEQVQPCDPAESLIDTAIFSQQTQLGDFLHVFDNEELLHPSLDYLDLESYEDQAVEFAGSVPIADNQLEINEVDHLARDRMPTVAPSFASPHTRLREYKSMSMTQITNVSVPQDAVFLLKHYSSTVLKLLTPFFCQSKTPWHILFIPQVKNCLAALTLGETVDHASLCVFYGTLAISALSLGGISQSKIWQDQSKLYLERSQEEIQVTLEKAYDPIKSAKYKSILMALLTMVQINMITGNHDQTECYLLETEKFIRMKGLNRRKSRKVRLLHHCYAYERIIHESLITTRKNSQHRRHVRRAIEESGAQTYSADALSFRLGQWYDLEQDMLRVKGNEESENDLHLQIPGQWSQTLYPEIFGVPEAYLLLLSLVIRLRQEKIRAERGELDVIALQDFTRRAKSLEICIKHVKDSTAHTFSNSQSHVPQNSLDYMLEAMQNSLSIYFYRQIYDLDASLLQSKVVAVLDCLLRFESVNPDESYGSARLIWPAFIAACEAEDLKTQAAFAQWFEVSGRRSGLQLFREALDNVESFRAARRGSKFAVHSESVFAQSTETIPFAS